MLLIIFLMIYEWVLIITNSDLIAFFKPLWHCLVPITDGVAHKIRAWPPDRKQDPHS